jgi:hypothetical protein
MEFIIESKIIFHTKLYIAAVIGHANKISVILLSNNQQYLDFQDSDLQLDINLAARHNYDKIILLLQHSLRRQKNEKRYVRDNPEIIAAEEKKKEEDKFKQKDQPGEKNELGKDRRIILYKAAKAGHQTSIYRLLKKWTDIKGQEYTSALTSGANMALIYHNQKR